MANSNRKTGLIPVRHISGRPVTGSGRMYLCSASNAIYVGDPVKSAGSAGAAATFVNGIDCEGMPTIDRAAAGDTLLGVVRGFLPLQSDLSLGYKAADSTKRIALVIDDPDMVFEIQEDSVGNNIAVTQVNNNFDMAAWAAGTSTGISAVELDSSDSTGTATAQFRLLGRVNRADNEMGTNCKWEVMINEHEFKTTTGV